MRIVEELVVCCQLSVERSYMQRTTDEGPRTKDEETSTALCLLPAAFWLLPSGSSTSLRRAGPAASAESRISCGPANGRQERGCGDD